MADEEQTNKAESAQKRKRTESETTTTPVKGETLPQWVAGQSPPRFLSIDELVKTADGLNNMALAHEIAVNDAFKLEKPQLPPESLKAKVTVQMRKAFFDKLREELQEQEYDMALGLLEEIKEMLVGLLLPQHKTIRAQIDETIDLNLIRQRVEHGDTNFTQTSKFIIDIMAKLCAPARDEQIARLRSIESLPELFEGILSTLDDMHMDFANYQIESVRPHVKQTIAQYEREKFDEFLKVNPAALTQTHAWLERSYKRHHQESAEPSSSAKPQAKRQSTDISTHASTSQSNHNSTSLIIRQSFCDLLIEDDLEEHEVPETLLVDSERLYSLHRQCQRLVLAVSSVVIATQVAGRDVAENAEFKASSLHMALIVLEQCDRKALNVPKDALLSPKPLNDNEDRHKSIEAAFVSINAANITQRKIAIESALKDSLSALSQILLENVINWRRRIHNYSSDDSTDKVLDAQAQNALLGQIQALSERSQPVRRLVGNRMRQFLDTVLQSAGNYTTTSRCIQVPSPLTMVQPPLQRLCSVYVPLVQMNRAAFGDIYTEHIHRLQAAFESIEESNK